MIYIRALVVGLCFAVALAACEPEPVVVVGQLPHPSAGGAGSSGASAGSGGDDDGEHDDVEDHECTEFEPVCGTDNQTYRNRCEATAAGVRVAREGAC